MEKYQEYDRQFRIKIEESSWDENVSVDDIEKFMISENMKSFSSGCMLFALNKGNDRLKDEIIHFNHKQWINYPIMKNYEINSIILLNNNVINISFTTQEKRQMFLDQLEKEYPNKYVISNIAIGEDNNKYNSYITFNDEKDTFKLYFKLFL